MRPLYIISLLGIGGAEKQLCILSDNLFLYKKHEINIIVLNNIIKSKPKNKNIKIFSLNISKNPISFLIGLNKLINLIKKLKPDLIHAHLFHAIIISRITKILFRKIPLICTLHNSIYKIDLRSKLLKYSSFLSDLNTALSRSALESYLKLKIFTKDKSKFIYNGINFDEYKFNLNYRQSIRSKEKIDNRTYLFVANARLIETKGLLDILRIFNQINCNKKRLIIIGNGPLKSKITNFIIKNEMSKFVKLKNQKTPINKYLSAADVLINSSYKEGFSLTNIEAIASKTLIIATDINVHKEIIKKNEFFYKKGNIKQLSSKIDQLVTFPKSKLNEIRIRGYKNSKINFSIMKTTNIWYKTYIELSKL